MYPNTIFPEIYKPKPLITPILPLAFRKSKTSDFFDTKYGGFAPKVRRFLSKKSDVFVFRYAPYSIVETASVSPSTKKVFGKKPTFPTPMPRTCCIYWQFRVKDRV